MLHSICQWLESTSLGQWISQSDYGFASIETVHVLALTAVVGTVFIVDLRLLGLTSSRRSVRVLSADALPVTWGAFVVALIAGALLFMSKATQYIDNIPFRLKMLAMALAGVNMLAFHFITYRGVEAWVLDAQPPLAAKLAGGLSITLWILIVVAGRWIGFTTH